MSEVSYKSYQLQREKQKLAEEIRESSRKYHGKFTLWLTHPRRNNWLDEGERNAQEQTQNLEGQGNR